MTLHGERQGETFHRRSASGVDAAAISTGRPPIIGGERNALPFAYLDENGRRAGFAVGVGTAVSIVRNALLAKFGEGLEATRRSGDDRRTHNRWMGGYKPPAVSLPTTRKHLAYVIVPLIFPLLAIFFLALLWNRELRRQVARRTAELRESLEFQRAIIACSPVALYCVDEDGLVTSWNILAERIFGWQADEVIGKPLPIVPDDKQEEFDALHRKVVDGEGVFDQELVRRRKNGDRFPMRLSAVPMRDDKGAIIGILAVAEDATSRKLDQERIEHLNRLLRAIREINQLIVRETDVQRLIDGACNLLVGNRGYGGAWLLLVDELARVTRYAQVNVDAAVLAEAVETNALPPCCRLVDADNPLHVIVDPRVCENCAIGSVCSEKSLWCACLRCDGRVYGYLAVWVDARFVSDDEERGLFIEMADDLGYALHALAEHDTRIEAEKEREIMQRQLLHAQKMASVGRLAGGVAHDFNNLLMGIQNFAEMCRKQVGDESQIGNWLDEILAATRRSATLTRQLLAFARKQTTAPKILNLNDDVGNLLKLIRRLIGEDIDLIWRPGKSLEPVKMDCGQLDQLLTNLCVNARDAIHGVGKITIETTNVVIDADYCAENLEARPGRFVMLSVADDGCGMEPFLLEQIFEPFFTTKHSGEGTGLGLSMVYGIVKQNHGFVNVYSEPENGTIFRVYFPTCEASHPTVAPAAPPEVADQGAVGGGESILLVEDEPTIRSTLTQFLDLQGYAVFAADTPEEALNMVDRRDAPFDLLITDVVMPGMNGRELATAASAKMPNLKCLFISGYTANVIAHRGILDKGINFLSKPFTCAELMQKLQHILCDSKGASSRPETKRHISAKTSADI